MSSEDHQDMINFFEKSLESSNSIIELAELTCSNDIKTLYADVHDVVDKEKLEKRVETIFTQRDQLETIVQNKYQILSKLTADRSGESSIPVDHLHQKKVVEAFQQIGNVVKNIDVLRSDLKFYHSSVLPVPELENSAADVANVSNKAHFYNDCIDRFVAKFDSLELPLNS